MIPVPLKLRAVDAEDVQIISAILQDSIVPVCDMAWQKPEGRFIMVTQRLCREAEDQTLLNRVCCAVDLSGVTAVQTHGLDLGDPTRMLELLMLGLDGETLHMIFADDARIRITFSDWSLKVEDFGEPWPAACQPRHDSPAA